MKRHLNSEKMTGNGNGWSSSRMCRRLELWGMMLGLSLCCGGFTGCLHSPDHLRPAISQGALGNSVIATLPAGTKVVLPNEEQARVLAGALVNETRTDTDGHGRTRTDTLVLVAPLKVCTPAYIAERDAREIRLMTEPQKNAESTKAGR